MHNLGLNAMEVQLVRVNVVERPPEEEEVGMTPLELESDLVVEIMRQKGKKAIVISDPNEAIKDGDMLTTLSSGLVQNMKEIRDLGLMGKELDVMLSMHTPYYIDMTSNNELTAKSMNSIKWAGSLTDQMGGGMVISHIGLYGDRSKKEATEIITENVREIMAWWQDTGIKPRLGFETSGRQEVFGSLDELLALADEVEGVVPIINFAHMHARQSGTLREPADFGELFDQVRSYVKDDFYTHFSGVEHEAGNEKRVTPIKKGDLKFEPLAEYLADNAPTCTVISSSPLLEHDAMYMKVIFERILMKRVSKETKGKKPEKPKARSRKDQDDEYEDDDD
ncbi:MAG: TIM barrel protein [Methanomassiliicoccales archaeon]